MATTSLAGLQALVADIGLQPIPSFTAADVLNNPLDIYHLYLAENFQTLVECEPELVYSSIQLSNTIENGDLDIVLPRLKLSGPKPRELAGELIKKVSWLLRFASLVQNVTQSLIRFLLVPISPSLRRSLQRWHPYPNPFPDQNPSTTTSPLRSRTKCYLWYFQVSWPTKWPRVQSEKGHCRVLVPEYCKRIHRGSFKKHNTWRFCSKHVRGDGLFCV